MERPDRTFSSDIVENVMKIVKKKPEPIILITSLQHRYGFVIPPEDMGKLSTPFSIVSYVRARLS